MTSAFSFFVIFRWAWFSLHTVFIFFCNLWCRLQPLLCSQQFSFLFGCGCLLLRFQIRAGEEPDCKCVQVKLHTHTCSYWSSLMSAPIFTGQCSTHWLIWLWPLSCTGFDLLWNFVALIILFFNFFVTVHFKLPIKSVLLIKDKISLKVFEKS